MTCGSISSVGTTSLLAQGDSAGRDSGPCSPARVQEIRARAAGVAADGALERARLILEQGHDRCPVASSLHYDLGAVHLRLGEVHEAGRWASRYTHGNPADPDGWNLLAATRYLQDDRTGALDAWSRGVPPSIRRIVLDLVPGGGGGARSGEVTVDVEALTGVRTGDPLDRETLLRMERRLAAIPAAADTRVSYRILEDGSAVVEAVLRRVDLEPLARSALVGHGLRLAGGRVDLELPQPGVSLGRGALRGARVGRGGHGRASFAHPAPVGPGVWRWTLQHGVTHVRSAPAPDADGSRDRTRRLARTSILWGLDHWWSGTVRGGVITGIERRSDRGDHFRVGVRGTLRSAGGRGELDVDFTRWIALEPETVGPSVSGGQTADAFARVRFLASLSSRVASRVDPPAGLRARLGLVLLTDGVPPDHRPALGGDRHVDILLRARSDLDSRGYRRVRSSPVAARLHGGVEVIRPLGSVGPVGIGLALFADAAAPGVGARDAELNVGAGVRLSPLGLAGWVRVDGAWDPTARSGRVTLGWEPDP